MHDGSDEPCCGTNGGYCGVEWRGTDGAEWIDIHDDACSGTDFFRVSPGCGIEVKTDSGDQNGDMRAYTYNEGSVLVCGYECECRATPGCDTVRYLRIFATGPAAYDQGDEDECEGDEDDDDDWDEDEDEDCDIETSDDRSSSPSGTTNHGAGNGWCYSDLDEHVGCAASPGDCWAMCEDEYGDGVVAIDWDEEDGGSCYCQNDCECMEDVGDIGSYLITRDSRVGALPHECGPDEGDGDEDWMWDGGCRPDYCTSTDGEDGYDCCASMDWGEPATCANGYTPMPSNPSEDDCEYTCCPVDIGTVTLYEDKSRGAGCDALDYSGNVVDADSADHCCQDEDYCCFFGACASDSDYCGYRFHCPEFRVTGDLTFEGITYEAAQDNTDVFVAAVADLCGVAASAVTVEISEARRRRRLAEGIVVTYTVGVATANEAQAVTSAISSSSTADVDAAISKAATDAGVDEDFDGVTTTSVGTPTTTASGDDGSSDGNGGADAASAGLIGGAVAGVAVIAAIGVGAFLYMRSKTSGADSPPLAEVQLVGSADESALPKAVASAAPPLMPPPPPTGRNFCSACGAPLHGQFCAQCGARA